MPGGSRPGRSHGHDIRRTSCPLICTDAAVAWYEGTMTSEQDAHPEPVIVASFGSVGEAEVAQAKLRAYEIESAIVDNDGGGVIPVDGDGQIQLEVRAVDGPAASEILDDTGA